MVNIYKENLIELLENMQPELSSKKMFSFKNCFGAVAGYIEDNIFISCGKFGLALKLPEQIVINLIDKKGATPLRYFPNGHIKKDYAVLTEELLENKRELKKLVQQSIEFVTVE